MSPNLWALTASTGGFAISLVSLFIAIVAVIVGVMYLGYAGKLDKILRGEGNSTNAGLQVFYGVYPTIIQSIANGIVYTATNEHTMPNPFYKGCTYRAINATDGTEIWTLSGYPSEWSSPGSAWATADGFITAMSGLDNKFTV